MVEMATSPFWSLDGGPAPALLSDRGLSLSYDALAALSDHIAAALPDRHRKRLGLVLGTNRPAALAGYLAGLRAGDAVWLLDARLEPSLIEPAVSAYRPDWIWLPTGGMLPDGYQLPPGAAWSGHGRPLAAAPGPGAAGYQMVWRVEDPGHAIFGDLAVLLSTSGSTGSPKLVRLSHANLQANAASIASYLNLSGDDRPITTLPLAYSYGLSVINSHLLAGAAILLTEESVVNREFWDFFSGQGATSLAGVPYLYRVLHRLALPAMRLPRLRTLTQAGGRLDVALIRTFAELAGARGWTFFTMYGQTEATARISYLPPELTLAKAGSIGVPVPGGHLDVDLASQELIYRGPNVMLGYAIGPEDLSLGDVQRGVLATGDLGYRDEDGLFYVTGRKKRMLKVHGHRLNLDELERSLEAALGKAVACVGADERLVAVLEEEADRPTIRRYLTEVLHLSPRTFAIVIRSPLPRFSSGKVDYGRLEALGA